MKPPLQFHLRSIGLLGPGLPDWCSGRALLAEPASWRQAPTVLPQPQRLPAAERRRAGDIVKLSIAVAEQACAAASIDPATLATVFSASTGDANNCHALCETLSGADRLISPTRFTNSVHNAAAGYWHIATASQAPSTSLCAFDASFGAGLLEAAVQCVSGQRPVLLVAADVAYPEPMRSMRPIADAFGVALLLSPCAGAGDLARVELQFASAPERAMCSDAGLEALRRGNPAARSLPLLQALARANADGDTDTDTATLTLDYLDELGLQLRLTPPPPQ